MSKIIHLDLPQSRERRNVVENPGCFSFTARGHPLVASTHPTTLEITRESNLTPEGDCIVAVSAESGLRQIPSVIRRVLSTSTGRGRLTISVQDQSFTVEGKGSRGLTFAHPTEIVVRRSSFVSDRTLMVYCDKAARDIPREMVKLLQDPDQVISIEISTIKPERR